MDWRRQRGEEEEVAEQLVYCEEGLTMDVLSARVHVGACVCVCACVCTVWRNAGAAAAGTFLLKPRACEGRNQNKQSSYCLLLQRCARTRRGVHIHAEVCTYTPWRQEPRSLAPSRHPCSSETISYGSSI